MVVAAYGLILPQAVLDVFPLGCINIHASLLPRWRGAAPIQRAILAGDRDTGISIMRMEAGPGYRSGISAASHPHRQPTILRGSLHDKLASAGRALHRAGAAGHRSGQARGRSPASRRCHLRAQDRKARGIDRLVAQRAGDRSRKCVRSILFRWQARTLRGEPLRIWRARAVAVARSTPGPGHRRRRAAVSSSTCGSGSLLITELQRAGGKRLPAADFHARRVMLAWRRVARRSDRNPASGGARSAGSAGVAAVLPPLWRSVRPPATRSDPRGAVQDIAFGVFRHLGLLRGVLSSAG